MKRILPFLLLLWACLGCEQPVDPFDLPSTPPRLVVEGDFMPDTLAVRLSVSTAFFGNTTSVPETGAVLSLLDMQGYSWPLREQRPGYYVLERPFGALPNHYYTLQLQTSLGSYTASDYSDLAPAVDSVSVRPLQAGGTPEEMDYLVYVAFSDNALVRNYYLLEVYDLRNGKRLSAELLDDQILNGQLVRHQLRGTYALGDSLAIRLYALSRRAYDYRRRLEQLLEGSQGGGQALPENPPTNVLPLESWQREALGFFSVRQRADLRVVVRPEQQPPTAVPELRL